MNFIFSVCFRSLSVVITYHWLHMFRHHFVNRMDCLYFCVMNKPLFPLLSHCLCAHRKMYKVQCSEIVESMRVRACVCHAIYNASTFVLVNIIEAKYTIYTLSLVSLLFSSSYTLPFLSAPSFSPPPSPTLVPLIISIICSLAAWLWLVAWRTRAKR